MKVLKPRIRRAQGYFGDINVKLINYAVLEDFVRAQTDLASKTKHELLSAIHKFFSWLLARDEIQEMPRFPKIKVTMNLRKTIDKETQSRILEEIRRITPENPKIYLACLWLATYINVRPGELINILEEDINRESGVIWIRHHKTESTNDLKFIVVIPEDIETLKQFPQGFPKMHFFRLNKGNGAAKPGDRFGKGLLYDVWSRACKNLGIEGVPLYPGTRHSSAQDLRRFLGAADIKRLAGTDTTDAFNRYFQVSLEELRDGFGLTRTTTDLPDHQTSLIVNHKPT